MEKLRGGPQATASTSTQQITYEELQPTSNWTHDTNAHVLRMDLPGFRKEDVKVQVDNLGKLTVTGERRAGEGKYSRFKQVFDVPSDSDIEKISGKLERGILTMKMPLKEVDKKEAAQKMVASEIPHKEEKPTAQKQEEPKKDDAAIGKDGAKKEEKLEPKTEDTATGKESTKKIDKPSEKEKEKPNGEDAVTGKDSTKKEENPKHTQEETKKDDCARKGTKKEEIEGDKHKKREKECGFVDSPTKKNEKGWRTKNEEGERMVMEGEEEDEEALESDLFNKVMEKINKNKAVIAAAALAFTFGVYLSRKFR